MKFGIEQAKQELKNVISLELSKDAQGRYIRDHVQQLPVMLVGPAGAGKTQTVGNVARELGIGLISYSLTHLTRQSLLGLPEITCFTNEGREIKDTRYTLSEIIGSVMRAVAEGQKEGILLLDEANCASETIQPSLLSFFQTKVLGNTELPEGWILVLCGNPPKSIYNKNARAFDAALVDRLRVIEVTLNNKEYYTYAKKKDFHSTVLFYLFTHIKDAYLCEESDAGLELVTYRTWENLSNVIKLYESNNIEVTAVTVNEFVKNDRIAKSFYEMYKYSKIKSEDYTDFVAKIYEGKWDSSMIESLKGMSKPMQYGITSFCFDKISRKVEEAFKAHESLQKIRTTIRSDNGASEALFAEEADMPHDYSEELKRIEYEVSEDRREQTLKDFHNSQIGRLKISMCAVAESLDHFIGGLEELGDKTLLKFYLNMLDRDEKWIYLMSNTSHAVIDKINEKLKIA